MKTTKIQIEAKIFDDPYSCGKIGDNEKCEKALLNDCVWYCEFYDGNELNTRMMSIEKLDQCKSAWKKAKKEEEQINESSIINTRQEIHWTDVSILPKQITLKESEFNSKMDDESDPVLIFDDMDNISIGFYSYEQERWFDSDGEYFEMEVKFWSPIPKGPTG